MGSRSPLFQMFQSCKKGQDHLLSELILQHREVSLDSPFTVCSEETLLLHVAAQGGHTTCIEVLLRSGADVNLQDLLGYTALHFAALNNRIEAIFTLLSAGGDPNVLNEWGNSPLDVLISTEDPIREQIKKMFKVVLEQKELQKAETTLVVGTVQPKKRL